MNRKLLLLLTGLILLSSTEFILAQDNRPGITGKILGPGNKIIEKATVSLKRATDSALVKTEFTDTRGIYEFSNLRDGRYFLSVTAVGFTKTASKVFELKSSRIELEPLIMATAEKTMTEVVVTGKRPLIEQKIDRTIVNVDASPTNSGSTAMDVLERSPGVTVSNDGAVSLKGKSGVIIMMDGKPTYLSQDDLANLLKNMPASDIDQIEIMTNPPAKYEASGNSGIINIKTKKNKKEGYNGSVTAGYTQGLYEKNGSYLYPFRTNFSTTMNYRKGKVNLFGNYSYTYRNGRSDLDLTRKFYDKAGSLSNISEQTSSFHPVFNNQTVKFGVDYYIDNKNILGAVITGFQFKGTPEAISEQIISSPSNQAETVLRSTTENNLKFGNYAVNVNYKHNFDSAGREITVDLDYIGYNNDANTLLTTDIYDGTGNNLESNLTLRNQQPGNINIYSVKSDYVHPLKKKAQFEAGFKSSFVDNDNEVIYERLENGNWIPDSRSNHFIYNENINAVYVNFRKQIKKLSFQAGLRLENTIAKGNQVTTDTGFNRNYTNLFPTGYLNYEFNDKHGLTLSFGRRIERPSYRNLNPFTWFLDSLTYRQGNPYLMPQFSNNIELRHSFKKSFITTFNYTVTNDVISEILKQDTENKITYLTVENVAKFTNIGLSISTPVKVRKWWSMNLFANVYNNHYEGTYYNTFTEENDPIDLSYTSFMVNISNTFNFPGGWSGEISGWYRGKGVEGLSVSEPMYFMALGGSKKMMKDKGTLTLNIRDPFHWQQYNGYTRYSDIDVRVHNKWDNRNITFTFSYRFGKQTVAAARRRNSGATEEQNRAGAGQN